MTSRELLQQKPETEVKDRHSGARYTVAELLPVVIAMLNLDESEAEEFCERLDIFFQRA